MMPNAKDVQRKLPAANIMKSLGVLAAAVFAVTVPFLYCLFSLYSLHELNQTEALFLARKIEKIVQNRPELWEYEYVRLMEMIMEPSLRGYGDHRVEIYKADGEPVVKNDFAASFPTRQVRAIFFDAGRPAGSVTVIYSIRRILAATLGLAIFSFLAGYLLYYIFSSYPLKTLHLALTDLKRSVEEQRRNRDRAERLAGEMAIVAEIGRLISSTLNTEDVFELFAEQAGKLIDFERINLVAINLREQTFAVTHASGSEIAAHRGGTIYPLAGSTTELIYQTKSGLIIQEDREKEISRLYPAFVNTRKSRFPSKISVPMIVKGEVTGVLHLRSLRKNAYAERDLSLAETIAAQISGAIANAALFSDLKRLEEEKGAMQERLFRSEKMEALGQMAGGVAHDLNNILGVSMGYAELLRESVPEGSSFRSYADNILSSTEKCSAIIQDMLTMARRGVPVSKVINLNAIVNEVMEGPELKRLRRQHPSVTFKVEPGKDLLNLIGSPVHIEKAVYNLLSNAVEAIRFKGDVIVRTENRYIDKAVRKYEELDEGDYVVLTVTDTGDGIHREDLNRIFEPFYTKKAMGKSGTGLGLAIVWGTVKDHKGHVDVQSERGKGTTFTLFFPATREESSAEETKIPIEAYRGRGESLLLIDDVEGQRQVATAMLTKLGYSVHSVPSGEDAVEFLRNNSADMLILDMIMEPGIDGLETYRRALEINPRQKAVLVSGFSESDRVFMAQQLGAGPYVRKPYVIEKIGIAIRSCFDGE